MKINIPFAIYRAVALGGAGVFTWATTLNPINLNFIELVVSLIGAAGVVVTVFGIWLAVIFPRFVASLGSGIEIGKTEDATRYSVLLKSLYRSATVLCSALFILLILTFFYHASVATSASIFAFCALCCISLFESLFASIANGELAASDAINQGIVMGVVRRRRRDINVQKAD